MEEKELKKRLEKLSNELNERQLIFAEQLLNNGGNATLACKMANYECNSEASYASQAYRLKKHPRIAEYISISKQLAKFDTSMSREDIIKKLEGIIAFGSEYPIQQQMDALKTLNNMQGWNAPSKQEVHHTIDELTERTKDMSLDELKAYRQQYNLDIEH